MTTAAAAAAAAVSQHLSAWTMRVTQVLAERTN